MSRISRLRDRVREHMEDVRGERRRLVYELVVHCRNCETEREVSRHMAERFDRMREAGTRFGFIEVIALIQLGIAIWKFMKEMGWLPFATPDLVAEKVGDAS